MPNARRRGFRRRPPCPVLHLPSPNRLRAEARRQQLVAVLSSSRPPCGNRDWASLHRCLLCLPQHPGRFMGRNLPTICQVWALPERRSACGGTARRRSPFPAKQRLAGGGSWTLPSTRNARISSGTVQIASSSTAMGQDADPRRGGMLFGAIPRIAGWPVQVSVHSAHACQMKRPKALLGLKAPTDVVRIVVAALIMPSSHQRVCVPFQLPIRLVLRAARGRPPLLLRRPCGPC